MVAVSVKGINVLNKILCSPSLSPAPLSQSGSQETSENHVLFNKIKQRRVSQPWHYWHWDRSVCVVGGHPVLCRILAASLALTSIYLPGAPARSTPHLSPDNQTCLRMLPKVPRRTAWPWLRTIEIRDMKAFCRTCNLYSYYLADHIKILYNRNDLLAAQVIIQSLGDQRGETELIKRPLLLLEEGNPFWPFI